MMNFSRIGWQEARAMLAEYGEDGVHIVDVRDEGAYEAGHVENAIHLSGSNVAEFVQTADPDKPVFIDHVRTQLPYALISAGLATVAFFVSGLVLL